MRRAGGSAWEATPSRGRLRLRRLAKAPTGQKGSSALGRVTPAPPPLPVRSVPAAIAGLVVVVASGAIAAFATLYASSNAMLVAWGGALALALLTRVTLKKRTVVGAIMIYGYLTFGVAAALLYHPAPIDYYGPTPGVAALAAATPGYRYLAFFDVVALSLWVGFFVLGHRPAAPLTSARRTGLSILDAMPVMRVPSMALGLALIPLLLDAYGTGFHTVLHAATYLQTTGPAAASKVGRALGAVGLLVAGNVMFANPLLRMRLLATLVALCYAALYLGADTRFFGLVMPMLYLGGLLGGGWRGRQRVVGLIIAAVAALLMIQIPLALRGLPEHGLVASLAYIQQDPGLLFANPINNILFGAPLTLYIGHAVPTLPIHDLVTSLSPLPSGFTDYPLIQPTLRLGPTTPYSALGELLNQGWLYVAAIMGAFGATYALLERLVKRSIVPGLGLLVLSSVAALAVVESTEYNLRTLARFAYYAVAIVVLLVLASSLTRRGRARQDIAPNGLGRRGSTGPSRVRAATERAGTDTAASAVEGHSLGRPRRRAGNAGESQRLA